MQTTANYGLKKPDGTDVVDIQNFNDNADIIDAELKKINNNAGALSSLSTSAKSTLVAAINEVFQSGTNVKSNTISAVNGKGASLGSGATWSDIINAIKGIARGQGNAVESQVLSGVTFSNSDGTLRTGAMDLKAENIKRGVTYGGITGTLEEKQDILSYVNSNITNKELGFVSGEGLWRQGAYQEHRAVCYDKNGNLIKTINTPNTLADASHISLNWAVFDGSGDPNYLTDKNGTVIKKGKYSTDTTSVLLYHQDLKWFIRVSACWINIYDYNNTFLYTFDEDSFDNGLHIMMNNIMLVKNGFYFGCTIEPNAGGLTYPYMCFVDSNGNLTKNKNFSRAVANSMFLVNGV